MDPIQSFRAGMVVPASPLALNASRRHDERRQRALWRYYAAAGAGGVAVGVHTTQFTIREAGLFRPLLELAAEEFSVLDQTRDTPLVRIAGLCGQTAQATAEAEWAVQNSFHAGLLSLAAFKNASQEILLDHCRSIAGIIPVIGFYLQTAVGGCVLPYSFWRKVFEIENMIAVKVAPFNRYQTLDVVRAVADAGRDDIALYTGNDDTIVTDLLTPFTVETDGGPFTRHFVGGVLGHWAVWTKAAVNLHTHCRSAVREGSTSLSLLTWSAEVTDCNAAFFDAANGFRGCIAGLHEVLRRQGLFEGIWCLDPSETLSAGQSLEIDRVYRDYPHLNDDAFVAEHLDEWLAC